MDLNLAFFSELSKTEWGKHIYNILKNKMGMDARYSEDIFEDKELSRIVVSCEYLAFFIYLESSWEDNFMKEEYDFKSNIYIVIDTYNKTVHKGLEILFEIVNWLLRDGMEDFLLKDEDPIILKKQNEVLFTEIPKGFPFYILEREVKGAAGESAESFWTGWVGAYSTGENSCYMKWRSEKRDYDLVFFSKLPQIEWGKHIYDILKNKMGMDARYYEGIESVDNQEKNYFVITCEGCHFFTYLEEGEIDDLIKEKFDFEANISIHIKMFNKTTEPEQIFRLIGWLLMDGMADFLLLEEGSSIVLKKENETFFTELPEDFPFNLLDKEVIIISD